MCAHPISIPTALSHHVCLTCSFPCPTSYQQEFYNTNPTSDNISKVQAQIDSVKDVMIENIDKVLERGERIELLVDKTDRLNQQAFKFEKTVRFL